MPFAVVPSLIVAAVLVASGAAKLRHPDDLVGWADLGVPAALRKRWLLKFHPWGEIALGLALMLLGGVLGEAAAVIALALMVGYLIFVARIVRAGVDASCACFGARKRITGMTVARNGWYVLLSVAAVATAWMNPLWGGPLVALSGQEWLWMFGLATAAVTVTLTMWPAPETETDAVGFEDFAPTASDSEDDDYVRARTPAVPLTLASGEVVDLRSLSMVDKPLMLLALNPGCGSCVLVQERLGRIRQLLPEVSVRMLLTDAPERSAWTETAEPQSVHDQGRYVRGSIKDWNTPTAVLFGMDGLLAGGPVSGGASILEFVDDVYESLHGERPQPSLASTI